MSEDNISLFTESGKALSSKELAKKFDSSTEKLRKEHSGIGSDELTLFNKANDVIGSVNRQIEDIFSSLNPSGGASGIQTDLLLQLAKQSAKGEDPTLKGKGKGRKGKDKDSSEDAMSVLTANNPLIEQMISQNKTKYGDALTLYNLIIRIIPKMRTVLNTIANTVISPDDFTKDSLSIRVTGGDDDESKITRDRVETLLEEFEINKRIKQDVLSYLINGRLFYLISTTNKEVSRMLSEGGGQTVNDGSLYKSLKVNTDLPRLCEQYKLLSEASNNSGEVNKPHFDNIRRIQKAFGTVTIEETAKAAANIEKFISEQFIISDSKAILYTEDTTALTENAVNFFTSHSSIINEFSNTHGTNINLANVEGNGSYVDPSQFKGRDKAVFRSISPANIVPLDYNGEIYGYIHLDIVEIDPDGHVLPVDGDDDNAGGIIPPSSAAGNGGALQNVIFADRDLPKNNDNGRSRRNYENPNSAGGIGGVEDARLQLMADMFANRLSKETNIRLLKKDENLKDAIYRGLSIKKLSAEEKVRIVYLTPEEVVFIDRGQSIFDNVLFFCKLYIASLITLIMQNVLKSGEQRIVYVEVGLDNDGANSVQEVIRNLKSRDMNSILSMDMETVLNIQSQFQDYYIPVINGEKPISFDSIENGGNKSLDDEFLNWLSSNIFSGMGIPSAFVNELENIDFAKTLSMQNGRFLRDIIVEQGVVGRGLTEAIRRLYSIEVEGLEKEASKGENDTDESDTGKKIALEDIEVVLPPPSTLSLMTISESISTASSVMEQLTESIDLTEYPEDSREDIRVIIKQRLIREYTTSFDWTFLDDVVSEIKIDLKEGKFKGIKFDEEPEVEEEM